MPVNNASNDGRVHRFFLVNWMAPCPFGALNQVLATSIIQRIGTIIRYKRMLLFQRNTDQNHSDHSDRGPKLVNDKRRRKWLLWRDFPGSIPQ